MTLLFAGTGLLSQILRKCTSRVSRYENKVSVCLSVCLSVRPSVCLSVLLIKYDTRSTKSYGNERDQSIYSIMLY